MGWSWQQGYSSSDNHSLWLHWAEKQLRPTTCQSLRQMGRNSRRPCQGSLLSGAAVGAGSPRLDSWLDPPKKKKKPLPGYHVYADGRLTTWCQQREAMEMCTQSCCWCTWLFLIPVTHECSFCDVYRRLMTALTWLLVSLNSLGTRSDQWSSDAVIHVNTEENLTKHPKSKISDDDDGAALYHFFSFFFLKLVSVFIVTSIMIHAIPTVYIQKEKWQQSAKTGLPGEI